MKVIAQLPDDYMFYPHRFIRWHRVPDPSTVEQLENLGVQYMQIFIEHVHLCFLAIEEEDQVMVRLMHPNIMFCSLEDFNEYQRLYEVVASYGEKLYIPGALPIDEIIYWHNILIEQLKHE